MASDVNLIKAAFVEAKSRFGTEIGDFSNMYQSTIDISAKQLENVQSILNDYAAEKKKERESKEKQLQNFIRVSETNLQKLYDNEEPLPEPIIDAIEKRIKELQDDFELVNTIGENDTKENNRARRKILGELTRITNNAINLRADYMKFAENAKFFNIKRINKSVIDPAMMVIDLDNMQKNVDDGNMQVYYGDDGINFWVKNYNSVDDGNGNITYSGDPAIINMKMLKENFKSINTDLDKKYIEQVKNSEIRAQRDAVDGVMRYDENSQSALFRTTITDEEEFGDFANRRINGLNDELAFDEYLETNLSVSFAVLDNMFYDENNQRYNIGESFKVLDQDGDNDVDNQDIQAALDSMGKDSAEYKKFKQNLDLLIDVIANPDNKAFNFEESMNMLTDYYISFDKAAYLRKFTATQKTLERQNNPFSGGGGGGTEPYQLSSGGYMQREIVDSHVDFILNPEEGQQSSFLGRSYKYENGQFYREYRKIDSDNQVKPDQTDSNGNNWMKINEESIVLEGKIQNFVNLGSQTNYSIKNPEANRRTKFDNTRASEFIDMNAQDVINKLNAHYDTLPSNKAFRLTNSGNIAVFVVTGGQGGYVEITKPTNNEQLDELLKILASEQFTQNILDKTVPINRDYNEQE